MKRFSVLILLVGLLFLSFTACSSNAERTDIEAYWAMRNAMADLGDYSLNGEVFIERIDLGRPVIHRLQSGMVSASQQEARILFSPADGALAPFFRVPVSVLDGYVYADLADRAGWYINGVLAISEAEFTPRSAAEFLESTLVREPLTHGLEAHLLFDAFLDLFSEEDLEQHMVRVEDGFIITIEGAATEEYTQSAIYAITFLGGAEFVNEFVDADAANRRDVATFLAGGAADSDWADAYLTVSFAEEEDGFSLQANIYIPTWFSGTKTLTVAQAIVPPFTRPDGAVISMAEFDRYLDEALELIAADGLEADLPVGFHSPEEAVIAFLEEVRDFTPEFQTLEILGFIPPEALNELYLSEGMQESLVRQAEEAGADGMVSRVALFEMDGERHLMFADLMEHDGAWHISQLGGTIAVLLYLPLDMGHIPPIFVDEILGGIDLQAVLLPV